VKNPDYWGHDERYVDNQLPYMDEIRYRIIPDETEALTALRAAKIDLISGVSAVDAAAMKKTNPEILQIPIPGRRR